MSLLEYNIMKARHGRYADTAENRRLHRVGQEYGHAAQEEQGGEKKPGKGEDPSKGKRSYDTARKELSAVLSHKDEFISKYGEDEYNKRVGALVAEAKQLSDDEHKAAADKDFDKMKQPEKPKDTRSKKEIRTERLEKYKEQLKKVQEKMNQEGESEESRKMGEALEAKWKAKIEKLEAKVNRGKKKAEEPEKKKEAKEMTPTEKKVLDLLAHSSSKYNDISKVEVYETAAGNWELVYDGKEVSVVGGDQLDHDELMEAGLLNMDGDEEAEQKEPEKKEQTVKPGTFPKEGQAITYTYKNDDGDEGKLRIDKMDDGDYWVENEYTRANGNTGQSGRRWKEGEDYLKGFKLTSDPVLVTDTNVLEDSVHYNNWVFDKLSADEKKELSDILEKESKPHEENFDDLKKYLKKLNKDYWKGNANPELVQAIKEKTGLGDKGAKRVVQKLVYGEYSRLDDILRKKKAEMKADEKKLSKGEKLSKKLKDHVSSYEDKLKELHGAGKISDEYYDDFQEDLEKWHEDYDGLMMEGAVISDEDYQDFKDDIEEAMDYFKELSDEIDRMSKN